MNAEVTTRKKGQGISGSTLKIIAMLSMLIDHIGAAVLGRMLTQRGIMEIFDSADTQLVSGWIANGSNYSLYRLYEWTRIIGRTAFPIYCFLLVEGFLHTRNAWKYVARLGVFCLISEIPFDLAFEGKVLEFQYQNVFFTLMIGLVALIFLDRIGKRTGLIFLVSAAAMGTAHLLRTDYGWMGVACILVLYFLRGKRPLQLLAGYFSFVVLLSEPDALPAFLFLAGYRGERGMQGRYLFYAFYPAHLLILCAICFWMGIAAYPPL